MRQASTTQQQETHHKKGKQKMNLEPNNLEPRDVLLLNALDRIGLNLSCLTTAVSRLEPKETDDDAMARIADALEQLVEVAEACRLNHVESLTCGELMEGVAVSGPNPTIDGQYVVNPEIEFHDGLYANGGVFRDKDGKSWFALDVDQELKAANPQELRDIAKLFRTSFAGVLDFAAREWDKQLAAGEVTLDNQEEA